MRAHHTLSAYTRNFWMVSASVLVFLLFFVVYIRSANELDTLQQQHFKVLSLADELRQSSDDLTRMARAYVATGDPIYQRYYQEILDIRDGRRPRPAGGARMEWDMLSANPDKTRVPSGNKIALMELISQAGFTEQETGRLNAAKIQSDHLCQTELNAMRLVSSSGAHTLSEVQKAASIPLYDPAYLQEKISIIEQINQARRMAHVRLEQAASELESRVQWLQKIMILNGLVILVLLVRSYRSHWQMMGGTLEEIYQQLSQLGGQHTPVAGGSGWQHITSIKSWIMQTREYLERVDAENQEISQKNQRLTRLYNALSLCNQSIVRSSSEQELFERVCHHAVVHGGMNMAWIGLVNEDTQEFRPVAQYGDEAGYLSDLKISREPDQNGNLGPISSVLVNDEPFWYQNLQQDTQYRHWHQRSVLFGWKSMAILPLHRNGKVVGTFNLLLDQVDAFDEPSRRLLLEMAVDISHALTRFELEQARHQSLQMEAVRSYLIERTTGNQSVRDILHDVVLKLEVMIPDSMCTIMLLDKDGRRIRTGAAPNVPEFFLHGINGLEIAPGEGSCGNAMATATRTIVADIESDPFWVKYIGLTKRAGLRSCWSEPIVSSAGKMLGAFAIYNHVPGKPTVFQIQLLEMTAHYIANTLERKQAEETLRKLSQAVEQSFNAIMIIDRKAHIEYVNAAYLKRYHKTLEELVGQRPPLMYPGQLSRANYRKTRKLLKQGESWHGELLRADVSGKMHTDLIHISPVRDGAGEITHFLIMQEDISEKKRNEERIQYLAHFDALTGLPNRVLLEERARYAFGRVVRTGEPLAVIFFDLDHFKDINDSLGHSIGDALLMEVAHRLSVSLRADDTISRLGGDEFVLILPGVDSVGAERVVTKLMEIVCLPYHIGNVDLTITTSAGIAMCPDDGQDLETLSKNADVAMYRAKREGRNAYRFFTQEMQARSARHLELVHALRLALEKQQFTLHYQPQIDIGTGQVIGIEALLRWQHPELGAVLPTEFIPVAEESGMILQIGEWVLNTAVHQLRLWHELGYKELCMAVNLSAVQFRHGDLPHVVSQILAAEKMPAAFLELELTESVAMHDPEAAIEMMSKLHRHGVRMSIDDFGTGYSSLSYLKKFKVYKLKIDRSFVRDIHTDPEDKAIVSAVIGLAKNLGLKTIAEGVETAEQLEFLRQQGCTEVQGYYFAQPMPAAQLEEFIRQRHSPE